jgi:hypothetical protein
MSLAMQWNSDRLSGTRGPTGSMGLKFFLGAAEKWAGNKEAELI